MVRFLVVWMLLVVFNVGVFVVIVIYLEVIEMLEKKVRKGLIKYMINMCISKCCCGLG